MGNIYINITGGDGTGKTSVQEGLKNFLYENNFFTFSEPGGTKHGEAIKRAILTDSDRERREELAFIYRSVIREARISIERALRSLRDGDMKMFEVHAFAAARAESNELIKKKLKEGKNILGVRSYSCSKAYQGEARGVGFEKIKEAHKDIELIMPDAEIFLELPYNIAKERMEARKEMKSDRLDQEGEKFHRATIKGYEKYYEQVDFPIYRVNASQELQKVIADTKDIINKIKTPN